MFTVLWLLGYCVGAYAGPIQRFWKRLCQFLKRWRYFLWNHTWLLHVYPFWVVKKRPIIRIIWFSGVLTIGWLLGLYDLTFVIVNVAVNLLASSLEDLIK